MPLDRKKRPILRRIDLFRDDDCDAAASSAKYDMEDDDLEERLTELEEEDDEA